MTEDMDVQTEFDEDKWEQLTDFIDEHKDVRRASKKFYGKKVLEMGYRKMKELQETQDEIEDIIKEDE